MAAFTVEAVFVINITVWVLAAVCYLSVYSHDRAALYTLAQNYIARSVENGKEFTEAGVADGMKRYLERHLFLCRIQHIRVEKRVTSVRAEITFYADVHVPFVKRLLTGSGGRKLRISHGTVFAPEYVRDAREIRRVLE